MKCIQVIGILCINFCACAYLYISLYIKVILSLFLSVCFSCILSWIICIEFVMSLNIHFGFWFLVCYAAMHLATQLPQRRIQVVRSNKVARKRLTESNGTPAMDFDCKGIRKRRY